MAQWESGLLITFKKFPCYYLRLPHTGGKHQITFASSQWPFTSVICIQTLELRLTLNSTPCKITRFISYKTPSLLIFKNSLSGNKFSTIPGDLVTEVAIYREVKVRGGHSASINAENFILNYHTLPKLKKE